MLNPLKVLTFASALSCVLAVSTGQGSDHVGVDPVKALRRLQPALSPDTAATLARTFVKVSQESSCNVPWELLVSIAYHESSLGQNLFNARTKDYGLMQVSEKNLLRYGLSRDRVMKDAGYSIRFACKLLRENHDRYGSTHSYWLGIYRSGTALWKDSITRNARSYDRMVRATARAIGYQPGMHFAAAR